MNTYRITLTENHIRTIQSALEALSRIGTGQINYALDEVWMEKRLNLPHKEVESLCNRLKELYTSMEGYASLGIGSEETPEKCKIAYEILQAIRYRLAWDRDPKGGNTVDFGRPLKVTEEPLPIIEKKVEE
jgi:hypothetical protein